MTLETVLTILTLVIGFYMAWNIGANDVSNAMGTSVGSGALTLRRAVLLAAVLEFCGAYFLGANVSETLQSGIINPDTYLDKPLILILGMCGALLGTSIWLQIASYFGWPVSTTHAIVGAIVGFGALMGGFDSVEWSKISSIAISWVVSPLISGVLSFFVFTLLQRTILYALDPLQAARRYLPLFYFIVFSSFTLNLIFNGLRNLQLDLSALSTIGLSGGIGLLAAFISRFFLRKTTSELAPTSVTSPYTIISLDKAIKHLQRLRIASTTEVQSHVGSVLENLRALSKKLRAETHYTQHTTDYHVVEKLFITLQIFSACYVAFAHGANDVSNAIGPVAAVLEVLKNGMHVHSTPIPSWLLALGGVGIVIGLATWGWRVIETIGKKITALTPTRGFCAEFGAATTILLATKLGLPVSTTHCLVGSVLGVGLARGLSALNLSMVRDIGLSWLITLPASAGMSIGCFYILKAIFI
jgi:phosphate/sulfate permease